MDKCEYCPQTFEYADIMEVHEWREHPKQRLLTIVRNRLQTAESDIDDTRRRRDVEERLDHAINTAPT